MQLRSSLRKGFLSLNIFALRLVLLNPCYMLLKCENYTRGMFWLIIPVRLTIPAGKVKIKSYASGHQQQWHSCGFSTIFFEIIFLLSCLMHQFFCSIFFVSLSPCYVGLALLNCPMRFRTITHVFGEVGHTHNAVDQRLSVASTIFSNQRCIETPSDPYNEL